MPTLKVSEWSKHKMKNNNYEVDILVSDKPIKKYSHQGKTYIEAKAGASYTIRIKNNSWNRILAAASVDSLSVISGKHEEVSSSPGYVINGYNSTKIDGFRISDESVAEFKFDYKKDSYAASKQDNSDQNVGVIGVRIFNEKIKPTPVATEIHNHYHHVDWNTYIPYPQTPTYPYHTHLLIWGSDGIITTLGNTSTNYNGTLTSNGTTGHGEVFNCCLNNSSGHLGGEIVANNLSVNSPLRGFDLGTSMGKSQTSKVVEVDFERGLLVDSINIYYASRESLLEMGVPLTNDKQINFPEPFKDEGKYCVPPKNWKK